jgi:hypothetical protein
MANPVVSASLNKAAYAVGEEIVLTVNYSDADTRTVTVTVSVDDSEAGSPITQALTFKVDPLTVEVTDSEGRTWTKESDNGATAVFKAVA